MSAMRKVVRSVGWMVLVSAILAACSSLPVNVGGEPAALRMAVLPILDTLPMYVAQQEGLFEKHNVNVEFIPVASAAERDQIIAAGQADGMINELVSTLFYNKDEVQIQVVRFARIATSTAPQFHILASAQSGITTVGGLAGVPIGISEGTVIEYLTDRLLEAEGFTPEQIATIPVPRISDRLALLASGELEAAMLPDPLSFLAEQGGATIVLDDSSHPEFGYSVISFRAAYIDENPDAVTGFLAAIEAATALINADPGKWDALLVEQQLVPEPLQGSYRISPYPLASVPSKAQWDDVYNWANRKGLIENEVSYESSVTDRYLP